MKKEKVSGSVFKVEMSNGVYRMYDVAGNAVNASSIGCSTGLRKKAYENGSAIEVVPNKKGVMYFKQVPMENYSKLISPLNTNAEVNSEPVKSHSELKEFIHNDSVSLKPVSLVMSDLKWKYLIRSAVRAKNIMMTGPSGCGKTLAAKALVKALKRPDYYFNLGATQDARATLIGNTHFDSSKGTFFSKSAFVKAIETTNAVILLDELSRAHPDAWNILMTVLDQGQRYLRLDEAEGSPIIKVAEGVTFIATANIGNEYTSTRVMDRAILDRFTTIEMDVLNDVQEFELLKYMFPEVDEYDLKAVAEIAHHTREVSKSDNGKLSNMVSTRASVETAGLIYDGFSLFEAAEISMMPFFSNDGGVDSERTYITQLIQKYVRTVKDDDSALFNEDTSDSKEDTTIVW
jgi:nitric oxide reductase NorQ protein